MQRVVSHLILILAVVAAPYAWGACGSGYGFCRSYTLLHAQVAGGSDLSSFPVVLNATAAGSGNIASFATVANGGHVQNTATLSGATVPADWVVTSDSACATPINWEIETYTATTGDLIAWINIATLSHTADTTVWVCYGKSSVTTWQGDVNATWNANFKSVYHLATVSGAVVLTDSTATAATQVCQGGTCPFATDTGEIDGARNTTANPLWSMAASYGAVGFPVTVSYWLNTAAAQVAPIVNLNSSGTTNDGIRFSVQNPSGTNIAPQITLGGVADFNCSTNTLAQNTLAYVAYTVAVGAVNNAVCFVGTAGTFNSQTVSVPSASLTGTQNNLAIGRATGNNWIVDEVRVANVILTSGWLNTEFNNESSPSTFYTLGSEQAGSGGARTQVLILN